MVPLPSSPNTCTFVAPRPGSLFYAIQGAAEFRVTSGKTVRRVCIQGTGMGNLEPGPLAKGDVVWIHKWTMTTSLTVIFSTVRPIYSVGTTSIYTCP